MTIADVLSGEQVWHVEIADVLAGLRLIPDGVVSCAITSPPYYSLRDYGTGQWEGGDPGCDHVKKMDYGNTSIIRGAVDGCVRTVAKVDGGTTHPYRSTCGKCGARRVDQQIGLEDTPEAYVAKLVEVLREVHRCLHPMGTLWLNLGDSYASGGAKGSGGTGKSGLQRDGRREEVRVAGGDRANERAKFEPRKFDFGCKPKDLLGIPWAVAFALRNDGWYLRSAAPWVKRAAMPESCTDRPASALEYVFLLAKSERYYFDMEAVRVGFVEQHKPNGPQKIKNGYAAAHGDTQRGFKEQRPNPAGRSRRNSDWWYESVGMLLHEGEILGYDVSPQPYKGAHFATFPEKLVEPMVKAGSSEHGVCPHCFSPWVRELESGDFVPMRWVPGEDKTSQAQDAAAGRSGRVRSSSAMVRGGVNQKVTTGWRPSCNCYGVPPLPDYPDDDSPDPAEVERIRARRLELLALYATLPTVPAIILDPFAGSGTALAVAVRLGRRALGIDLSPEYLPLIQERVGAAERGQEMPLFEADEPYVTPGLFDGGD